MERDSTSYGTTAPRRASATTALLQEAEFTIQAAISKDALAAEGSSFPVAAWTQPKRKIILEITRAELDALLNLHAELCRRQMDAERYHTEGDFEALRRAQMRFNNLYANHVSKPEVKVAPSPVPLPTPAAIPPIDPILDRPDLIAKSEPQS